MKIRPVTRNDRDEWQRMRTCLFSCPDSQEIDGWFDAVDKGDPHFLGVAVLVVDRGDGSLAGFMEIGSRNYAAGCKSSPVAFLEGWYVDADVRRRGLGSHLVKAAEDWAIAHGYSEVASDTGLDNNVSLQAHLALGFDEVDRQICFRKRLR